MLQMSKTARAFQVLYQKGKITKDALKQAVMDGVITAEEYKEITGEDYE